MTVEKHSSSAIHEHIHLAGRLRPKKVVQQTIQRDVGLEILRLSCLSKQHMWLLCKLKNVWLLVLASSSGIYFVQGMCKL